MKYRKVLRSHLLGGHRFNPAGFALLLSLVRATTCLAQTAPGTGTPANAGSTSAAPAPTGSSPGSPGGAAGTPQADTGTLAPIDKADTLLNKMTFSTYLENGDQAVDFNLRHQFGKWGAWVGQLYDQHSGSLGRAGIEYDYAQGPKVVQPALEVGSNGAVSGSFYSELGNTNYLILGASRTNLKPFQDLFFAPSDAGQLGFGRHLSSYDKVYGYSIFDIRLHTRQQIAHLLWRHRLNDFNGITFDGYYKSGDLTTGPLAEKFGAGIYYDRPTWLVKVYFDPDVNFTTENMLRLAYGIKY